MEKDEEGKDTEEEEEEDTEKEEKEEEDTEKENEEEEKEEECTCPSEDKAARPPQYTPTLFAGNEI